MKTTVVTATEFKTRCLASLDEVVHKGSRITITKRGRPVATLARVRNQIWKSPEGAWAGKVRIPDAVWMADRSDLWEVVRQK